jgi:hypothetical protein
MDIKLPKGTKDLVLGDVEATEQVEQALINIAKLYGYEGIRTPIFEHTELFTRSVGDSSDIVRKEMYTFMDKGERSMTLRPEMTAGVIRSVVEQKLLHTHDLPLKLYYVGPAFRYERPQLGRFRQFHQFGVELIGSSHTLHVAETIILGYQCLRYLGFEKITLKINSLGDQSSRQQYREALKAFVPADIADQIIVLPIKEVVKILRVLPKDISAEVFSYFPIRFQKKVIALFTQSEIKSIIEELYADDAADLIDEMPANVVTKILFKEMRISLLVGFVLSFVNFFRIWLTYEFDVLLSLTVSLTLVVVIFAAKTIGSMLPLLAKKLNLDHALMAAPFIATLVDASALITYFLIASTLLGTAS